MSDLFFPLRLTSTALNNKPVTSNRFYILNRMILSGGTKIKAACVKWLHENGVEGYIGKVNSPRLSMKVRLCAAFLLAWVISSASNDVAGYRVICILLYISDNSRDR